MKSSLMATLALGNVELRTLAEAQMAFIKKSLSRG